MSADYHFITVWRVAGTVDEVKNILSNASDLLRWWPSVYLDVRVMSEGKADGSGRVTDLLTKGWLPYTLRWTFTVTEPVSTTGFALDARGDFVGTGRWTLEQEGPEVSITYDWRIRAAKPFLRYLTWLLRPVFSANHRWAMARGEESLQLELRRRRATSDIERQRVPAPPQVTFRRFVHR